MLWLAQLLPAAHRKFAGYYQKDDRFLSSFLKPNLLKFKKLSGNFLEVQSEASAFSASLRGSFGQRNKSNRSPQSLKRGWGWSTRPFQRPTHRLPGHSALDGCTGPHAPSLGASRWTWFWRTRRESEKGTEAGAKQHKARAGDHSATLHSNPSAAPFFLFVLVHSCLPLRRQAVSVYRRD